MKTGEYIRLYSRSMPGVLAYIVSILAAVLAYRSWGLWPAIAFGAGSVIFLGIIALISGLGPKAALGERDREIESKARAGLAGIREKAIRLANIRVKDDEVTEALALVSLKAASYVSSRSRSGSLDPVADNALDESLEIANAYLRLLDAESTGQRYKTANMGSPQDARAGLIESLRQRAYILDRAAMALLGADHPVDSLDIQEQL